LQDFFIRTLLVRLPKHIGRMGVVICLGSFLLVCGCDNVSQKNEQIVIASKPVKEVAATNATSECASLEGQVVLMYGKVTYIRIVSVGSSIQLDNQQNCTFRPNHKKEIASLKKGDFVRVKGRVESVTAIGVHLSYCIFASEAETH
jgi:phosphoglycerate-specific signal transduction histidine kinase